MTTYSIIKLGDNGIYHLVDSLIYLDLESASEAFQKYDSKNHAILRSTSVDEPSPRENRPANIYIYGWYLKISNDKELQKWLSHEKYQKINNIVQILSFKKQYYLSVDVSTDHTKINFRPLNNNILKNIHELLQLINDTVDIGSLGIYKC